MLNIKLKLQTQPPVLQLFDQKTSALQSPKILKDLSMSFYDRQTLFMNKQIICDQIKQQSHVNKKISINVPKFIKEIQSKHEKKSKKCVLIKNNLNQTSKLILTSPDKKIKHPNGKNATIHDENTVTKIRDCKSPNQTTIVKRPRFFV